MEKISSIPVVPVSPSSIDDDGSKLIKANRMNQTDTAVAVNKLIKIAKGIDARVLELEEEVIPLTDLSDVIIDTPTDKQLLEYESSTSQWKNKTKPVSTVSFCFVYPITDQRSPYYKFKSNKTITGMSIMAITAPSSAITVRVYKSDGTQIASQSFSGNNSAYTLNQSVSTDELFYAMIVGATNGVNLMTVELTVQDR